MEFWGDVIYGWSLTWNSEKVQIIREVDNRDDRNCGPCLINIMVKQKQTKLVKLCMISLKRTLRNKSALLNDPSHENKDDIAYRLIYSSI